MSLSCLFRKCRWLHVMNVRGDNFIGHDNRKRDAHAGLYQCSRCKTVSIGSPHPSTTPTPSGAPSDAGKTGDTQ